MSSPPDPWKRPEPPRGRQGFPLGVLLWLALFGGLGLLVWWLMGRYPGVAGDEDSWVEMVRLFGVLALVASGLLVVRRFALSEVLRNIAIWSAIFGVLSLGYSYRFELQAVGDRVLGGFLPDRATEVAPGVVRLQAGRNGHYYVLARVDGADIRFLIDTGASLVVLSPQDARRIGLDPERLTYSQRFETANGTGYGAPVRLRSLAIGPVQVRSVAASVNGEAMAHSLLGMSFLNRLAGFSFENETLTLRAR